MLEEIIVKIYSPYTPRTVRDEIRSFPFLNRIEKRQMSIDKVIAGDLEYPDHGSNQGIFFQKNHLNDLSTIQRSCYENEMLLFRFYIEIFDQEQTCWWW